MIELLMIDMRLCCFNSAILSNNVRTWESSILEIVYFTHKKYLFVIFKICLLQRAFTITILKIMQWRTTFTYMLLFTYLFSIVSFSINFFKTVSLIQFPSFYSGNIFLAYDEMNMMLRIQSFVLAVSSNNKK